MTKIEANTFYFCSSLEEVVIPENVESIGANAFGFCESLARVIIKFGGNLERSNIGDALEDSAFEGAGQKPGGLTLIVPGGQVYGLLLNGWGNKSSVMGKIHSEESLIGDFVADTNA